MEKFNKITIMATNREVFNEIARGWYGFRHHTRFKQELTDIADRWGKGKLLNIGCGHGPDFIPFQGKFELYGIDFSMEMVKLAGKYAEKFDFMVDLLVADAQYLPYRDGTFDYAIAVASYHHVKGKKNRLQAFRELHRVLKKDSEIFVTVWNRWQSRFWYKGREVLVPWKTSSGRLERYYYLYDYSEISRIIKQAGFEVIRIYPEYSYKLPVKFFSQNICVLAGKV
jgi:ubiquinone/menaquinone biosynthesis C-methylase UbiE